MGKINAAVAGLKILESWGIKRVYGLPVGSFHAWMYALEKEKDNIDFIQVKHEEVGSFAAVMHGKFIGNISVAMGSGGPGMTHLINGIYDAKMDHIPMLAIVGSSPLKEQNTDGFQELNQNPIYNDAAVYNKKVAYAEQIPTLFDEAIRQAYALRGPAVVEIPEDLGMAMIDEDSFYSSAKNYQKYPKLELDYDRLKEAADILSKAEKPIIFAGIGTRGAGEDVIKLSKKLKAPLLNTGINYDNFDHNYEGLMGAAGRVSDKPADEIYYEADVVLFIGSNWPFAQSTNVFKFTKKLIQIDINPAMLGKRGNVDVAILGDAKDNVKALIDLVEEKEESLWWKTALKVRENWKEYKTMLEKRKDGPLRLYQVYDYINKYSKEDAIYSVDVGDTTQTSVRHLHMNPKMMWRTSPLLATMGVGLPGAIAAKLEFKDRQVWSLSGDGAFSMVYPDIMTAVTYKLPIINVVFSNRQYGFIKDKFEDTIKTNFGTEFPDVDFASIARAQGAKGYTVSQISELDEVFKNAIKDSENGETVVIDAKVLSERPFPTEYFMGNIPKDMDAFNKRYEASNLLIFREELKKVGIKSNFDDEPEINNKKKEL